MKTMKKLLTLALTLALLAGVFTLGTFAADASAEAGQTVSVTLSFPNAYGVNGTLEYTNQGIVHRDKIFCKRNGAYYSQYHRHREDCSLGACRRQLHHHGDRRCHRG